MKLEEMRYFVETINSGSINQAAKALFVSQPALSRVLTALEKELGFLLLERSKQGITPTEEGMTVYDDCVRILQLYNESFLHWQTLSYRFSHQPMVIHLVALSVVCNNIMNQFVADMAEKYPHIQLKLHERQLPDVLHDTITQPHSIGICQYNIHSKADIENLAKSHQMQIIPLFDDNYRFFAANNHPLSGREVSLSELKNYTFTHASDVKDIDIPQLIDTHLTDIINSFDRALYLSSFQFILENAATGQTVTLSTDLMTRDNIYRKNGQLLPLMLTDFHLTITYFLLVPTQATEEEKIIAELLRSYYLEAIAPEPNSAS